MGGAPANPDARRADALLCAPPKGGRSAPPTPGDFLAKRKSPKIRQGPPGPWTPSTRGRTPVDSPTFCPSGIGCGNLNSQASSKPILPSHGLKVESVPLTKPEEKTRPICPLSSKWQIGLGLWQKVARREPERSAARAKRAVRDGYSFYSNRVCVPSLEPDCVRFPKFC